MGQTLPKVILLGVRSFLRFNLTTGKVVAMVKTAVDFIDARGGPAAIARATERQPGAVALWRHRNKLPRSAWPEIIKAFPDVTIDQLIAIEKRSAPTPSKPRKQVAA